MPPRPARAPAAFLTSYQVVLVAPLTEPQRKSIEAFFARESLVVAQVRKGKQREVDIRPLVSILQVQGREVHLSLLSVPGRPGISARAVLSEVVGIPEEEALLARIRKTKVVGQDAIP